MKMRKVLLALLCGWLLVACGSATEPSETSETSSTVAPAAAPVQESDLVGTITYTFDGRVYRIAAEEDAVPEDISLALDALSPGGGDRQLNISPDGAWLVLETERFDPECAGWSCLAILSSDLSTGDAVRADGQLVHLEGVSAVASGGNMIVYSSNEGPHEIDLWVVVRTGGAAWQAPLLLTADSPHPYNRQPSFSDDGGKLLFNCGSEPYASEGAEICEVGSDGAGFRVVLTPADAPAGLPTTGALHNPDYAPDGSIVFESDWAGEQVWRLAPGASEPVLVTDEFGNDNSPCVLPNGRIVSLWLGRAGGAGLHEMKVMSPDGGHFFVILTGIDIADVGVGCGG